MSDAPHNQAGLSAEDRAIVACPACGKGYRVPVRLVGKRLICKQCRHQWRAETVDSDLIAARIDHAVDHRAEHASDSGPTGQDSDLPPTAGSSSIAIDMSWVGRRIGRYQIRSLLGYGGMGVVWRAHDESLRRDVALKILTQTRDDRTRSGLNLDLFMQEARAVAKLQHPSVVSIYEVGEDQAHVFLALELMEGGTLREFVERHGAVSPRRLFEWMAGPARALALAHRRGVVHRDIKPGNLMFDDHGHLKLMDFGLADVSDEAVSEKLRGRAVGSLGWIAPETARGKGTTALSDIYCMGLVMMYALLGKPFINARSRSEIIRLHQNPPAPNLSDIRGLTPRGRQLLKKCLAVETADRFQSAEELSREMDDCADEDPLETRQRRRRGASIAVAATVLGVLVGFGLTLHYALSLFNQEQRNRQPVVTAKPAAEALDTESALALPSAAHRTDSLPSVPADHRTTATQSGLQTSRGKTGLSDQRVPWPQVVDGRSFRFVASLRGHVYHLATGDCGARDIHAANLVVYDRIEDARADGRAPCPRCKPDSGAQAPAPPSNVAAMPED